MDRDPKTSRFRARLYELVKRAADSVYEDTLVASLQRSISTLNRLNFTKLLNYRPSWGNSDFDNETHPHVALSLPRHFCQRQRLRPEKARAMELCIVWAAFVNPKAG